VTEAATVEEAAEATATEEAVGNVEVDVIDKGS